MKKLIIAALCIATSACTTQQTLTKTDVKGREAQTITSTEGLPLTTELLGSQGTASVAQSEPQETYKEIEDFDAEIADQEITVKFDTNSTRIKPSQVNELSQYMKAVADSLKGKTLEVVGYADVTGSPKYNTALSAKRAVSVKNWLINNGFSAKQVKTVGGGEMQASQLSEARIVKIQVAN